MSLRVFAPGPGIGTGAVATLDPEESHYLVRVRRARPGTAVELFDLEGGVFRAVVRTPDPKACSLDVRDRIDTPPEPQLELGLAIIDPKAMVRALERACESGAQRIVMLRTHHCQFSPPSPARIERAFRAVQRQCGRPLPPTIDGPRDLNTWLGSDADDPDGLDRERDASAVLPGYVAHPSGDDTAGAVEVAHRGRARLLVGPEGGLTSEEVAQALARGFRPLRLGPWILRTEIAVTAGLTRLNYG